MFEDSQANELFWRSTKLTSSCGTLPEIFKSILQRKQSQ